MADKYKGTKVKKTPAKSSAIFKSYIAADFCGSMDKKVKKMSDSLYFRITRGITNGKYGCGKTKKD